VFEHSYETGIHKNVPNFYNVCLAIPQSKKYYAWFSFYEDRNVCFLLDLTRDKKIGNIKIVEVEFDRRLSIGTLIYGSIINTPIPYFLIEDIFYYRGIPLSKNTFSEKLGYIQHILENDLTTSLKSVVNNTILFRLPVMWKLDEAERMTKTITQEMSKKITYNTHHIQFRSLNTISPFLNVFPSLTSNQNNKYAIASKSITISPRSKVSPLLFTEKGCGVPDYNKAQYGEKTVFLVRSDLQYDIYRLYAYHTTLKNVYYDVAYIPNYKTSVLMNSIFRNIRENHNIDLIEESDDEDDFQDIRYDKHVDLSKTINMECIFSRKFKRWIPIRIAPNGTHMVHINKLTRI